MALPFGAHVPFSSQNPSPLAFGFGLGVPQHHRPPSASTFDSHFGIPSMATQITPSNSSSPQAAASSRLGSKRRLETDDHEVDDSMDTQTRSPSPDRPKRPLGGKRLRLAQGESQKDAQIGQDGRSSLEDEDPVDVGTLLASLPPSSLLPIFTALINEKPELKPVVLSLIPRPTLDTALQAVSAAIRKLKDAYPYSQPTNMASASTGFGFGQTSSHTQSGPMRESYIRTRLRQPARDFTRLALSYVTYFSSSAQTTSESSPSSTPKQPVLSLHPSETFNFLHTLTAHVLRLPPLTLAELTRANENILFPRLQSEWALWLQKVDDDVNKWGGMYRDEVVRGWERGLEDLVAAEGSLIQQNQGSVPPHGYLHAKVLRDRWVERVGWLIGRRPVGAGHAPDMES